ncbi:MAG: protein-L-isoaspartate O-methyltransferase [Gammaproteobacteria bacterium]|jgi:protein-L-isoaspartate(D-aspartate) O-methyltransferase|nr:protein-L-isoaspartate O-methyltransferase [Gammaproteobacteria bacterium]
MDLERARYNMIEQQIRPWEVLDQRVLDRVAAVPREDFVPVRYRQMAFSDLRVPLEHDQVMMSPKAEARLLQELELRPTDRVLEIGTGSGFVTALLAGLTAHVDSVEIFADLSEAAAGRLAEHGISNVTLAVGDAARDWAENGPWDVILLTGSVPQRPDALIDRLQEGGRLVAVVGVSPVMVATVFTRDHGVQQRELFETDLPALIHAANPPVFHF